MMTMMMATMESDISKAMEVNGLVKTIIGIAICLVPLIGLILYMLYGPRTKYPVPLAPVPGPKRKNPYDRSDQTKTQRRHL